MQHLNLGDTDVAKPDLHHEGPLTLDLIDGLLNQLKTAQHEITEFNPPSLSEGDWIMDDEWILCKAAWLKNIKYAGMRMAAIHAKLSVGIGDYRAEDDRKCVDITLCILRDFEEAKSKGFDRYES